MTSLPETHNSSCAADFVAQGFAIRRVEFHHCYPMHVFSVFNFRFSVLALCSEWMSEWERDRETERKIELDREVKHWLLKEIQQRVSVLSVLRVCLCVIDSTPIARKIWIVSVCVTVRVRSRMRDIWAIRSPAWYLRPSFFIFFEYEGLIFYSTFSSANSQMPIEGIVLDLCDPLYGL